MAERGDFLLRSEDFTAGGAVLALGLAGFRAGCRDCGVDHFSVARCGDLLLCSEDFTADGAMFALGLAGLRTGCRNCRVSHFGMAGCGNFFLRNENFSADRAVLALGLARFRAGRRNCGIDHFGVALVAVNGHATSLKCHTDRCQIAVIDIFCSCAQLDIIGTGFAGRLERQRGDHAILDILFADLLSVPDNADRIRAQIAGLCHRQSFECIARRDLGQRQTLCIRNRDPCAEDTGVVADPDRYFNTFVGSGDNFIRLYRCLLFSLNGHAAGLKFHTDRCQIAVIDIFCSCAQFDVIGTGFAGRLECQCGDHAILDIAFFKLLSIPDNTDGIRAQIAGLCHCQGAECIARRNLGQRQALRICNRDPCAENAGIS